MDLKEQIDRIEMMQEETRRFCAEQRSGVGRMELSGWHIVITAMTVGAALFGAGAAFIKFFA